MGLFIALQRASDCWMSERAWSRYRRFTPVSSIAARSAQELVSFLFFLLSLFVPWVRIAKLGTRFRFSCELVVFSALLQWSRRGGSMRRPSAWKYFLWREELGTSGTSADGYFPSAAHAGNYQCPGPIGLPCSGDTDQMAPCPFLPQVGSFGPSSVLMLPLRLPRLPDLTTA